MPTVYLGYVDLSAAYCTVLNNAGSLSESLQDARNTCNTMPTGLAVYILLSIYIQRIL